LRQSINVQSETVWEQMDEITFRKQNEDGKNGAERVCRGLRV
jgi:hypothetical protein